VDALFNLELTYWLSGVGSFVNIGRHIVYPRNLRNNRPH
jgi:hypothetical protein